MAGKVVKNKVVVSAQDKVSPQLKKIKTNFRQFSKSIKGLNTSMASLGKIAALPIGGAIAGVTAIVKNSISSMVAYGGSVDDSSKSLGIAAKALQSFRYAATLGGSSASEMDSAIAMLNKNIANAANGSNQNLVGLMKHLGISMKDANGKMKTAAELMPEIADAIKSQTNSTQKAYIATQFFGKSGQNLIKTLADGSEGLKLAQKEAEHFGAILSDESVQASAQFGDSLSRTKYAVQGLQNTIGSKLLPVLQPMLDNFNELIARNREWFATTITEAVKDFASSIREIDFKAIINGLITFTRTSVKVLNALGGLKTIGIIVAGIFAGKLVTAIFAVGKALMFLALNPVGAIITGIAALIAGGIALWKNWDAVCAYLTNAWNKFADMFPLTAKVLVWFKEYIVNRFNDFIALPEKIIKAYEKISAFFKILWSQIKEAFFAPFESASKKIDGFIQSASNFWGKAKDLVGLGDNNLETVQNTEYVNNILGKPLAQTVGQSSTLISTQNKSEVVVRLKTDPNVEAEVEKQHSQGATLNTAILADTGGTR